MDKFNQDWNLYNLAVNSDKGSLSLWWEDVETLAKYTTLQSGIFGVARPFSKQVFFETFPKFYQNMWDITYRLGGFDLPNNAVVIDIGSGVGIIDLLLAKYLPEAKIYLIDKQELNNQPGVYYTDNYFFYNSWKPTLDCINRTDGLNDKITLMAPEDAWPESADCITSYFSWCMHYPKEKYWSKVKNTLKPGGKLIVDVRKLKDRNTVEEISDELKCIPKKHEFKNTIVDWIDNNEDETLGHRCVWTNNA
jgi:SAM-dependent methyltransferase